MTCPHVTALQPVVEVLPDVAISRMLGDQRLEGVEIKYRRTGETRTVRTPAVFTFIGAIPCTGWLPAEDRD